MIGQHVIGGEAFSPGVVASQAHKVAGTQAAPCVPFVPGCPTGGPPPPPRAQAQAAVAPVAVAQPAQTQTRVYGPGLYPERDREFGEEVELGASLFDPYSDVAFASLERQVSEIEKAAGLPARDVVIATGSVPQAEAQVQSYARSVAPSIPSTGAAPFEIPPQLPTTEGGVTQATENGAVSEKQADGTPPAMSVGMPRPKEGKNAMGTLLLLGVGAVVLFSMRKRK